MDDEKFCLWAIGIAIILFAAIFGMTKYDEWKADDDEDKRDEVILIKEGDEISVDYTGRFEDSLGTVFDTSRREIAENGSIPKSSGFQVKATYDDLTFTVGSEQTIPGFDSAVLGKKVGDQIVVSIPPSEGYGPSFDEMRYNLNTTQTLPVRETMEMDDFARLFGEIEDPLGKTLSHPVWSWPVTVVEADPTEVTFINQPIFGDSYNPFEWNTTVEDISTENNVIRLLHHTEDIMPSTNIPAMVISKFDMEWFNVAITLPQWDEMGMGRVTYGGGEITIDFNKEVAGKTLIFEIEINSINRGE